MQNKKYTFQRILWLFCSTMLLMILFTAGNCKKKSSETIENERIAQSGDMQVIYQKMNKILATHIPALKKAKNGDEAADILTTYQKEVLPIQKEIKEILAKHPGLLKIEEENASEDNKKFRMLSKEFYEEVSRIVQDFSGSKKLINTIENMKQRVTK